MSIIFTAIICDERIINDIHHKYHVYLKPFLETDNLVICKWNPNADTLDEAVPGLREEVRHKKEWRAIIVNDSSTWSFDAVNKRNPFDYVDSFLCEKYKYSSFEEVKRARAAAQRSTELAMTNPLTKLSIWLCGAPVKKAPALSYEQDAEYFEKAENPDEYFKRLKQLNLSAAEVEYDWVRALRYRSLSEKFELNGELFNAPQAVFALCERAKDVAEEVNALAWKSHTEFDYSQFYKDNLYPEKLRYLICDILYLKGSRNETAYFNFLSLLLMLAANDCPSSAIRSNRVYKLAIEIDSDCVKELCVRYKSKLLATNTKIDIISKRIEEQESQPLDNSTAEERFETSVTVPIELMTHENRENLMAQYKGIGLSKDCPGNEYEYWDDQYNAIGKFFIRFLREPRRAVKKAARKDFHAMNRIDDESALQLNEYQLEDIAFILDEEERKMVSTVTARLYDTTEYKEKMEQADKDIRRGIGQRMTRRKTIRVGLIAGLAYLLGFLPLIFGDVNNMASVSFSFLLTCAAVFAFLGVGMVFLFVLRHRLINRFKHFNYVMSGIIRDIERSVETFSVYLSHACNVMREFSVLTFKEKSYKKKQNILLNHKRLINNKIKEVEGLFAAYAESDGVDYYAEEQPYDFDFLEPVDYEYDMPYNSIAKEVEFMQAGNTVLVPVDYIKAVTLVREELYD